MNHSSGAECFNSLKKKAPNEILRKTSVTFDLTTIYFFTIIKPQSFGLKLNESGEFSQGHLQRPNRETKTDSWENTVNQERPMIAAPLHPRHAKLRNNATTSHWFMPIIIIGMFRELSTGVPKQCAYQQAQLVLLQSSNLYGINQCNCSILSISDRTWDHL